MEARGDNMRRRIWKAHNSCGRKKTREERARRPRQGLLGEEAETTTWEPDVWQDHALMKDVQAGNTCRGRGAALRTCR